MYWGWMGSGLTRSASEAEDTAWVDEMGAVTRLSDPAIEIPQVTLFVVVDLRQGPAGNNYSPPTVVGPDHS